MHAAGLLLAASTAEAVTATGLAALLSVACTYSINAARRARSEIKDLRRDNAACTWRQIVMEETLHDAGMRVPPWLWGPVPADLAKLDHEEQRSLAQRMLEPFSPHPHEDDQDDR